MSVIRFTPFGGLIPKSDPSMLPAPAAQIAHNCRFSSGQLEAFNLASEVMDSNNTSVNFLDASVATRVKSLYRFGQSTNSDSEYWLASINDTNFVKGPIAGDTEERTLFTAVGLKKPQITLTGRVGIQGLPRQTGSYDLGIPPPTIQPIATVSGDFSPTAIPETRYYIYTFVNSLGEESPPSPASNEIIVRPASTLVTPGTPAVEGVTAVAPQAAVAATPDSRDPTTGAVIPGTPYIPAVIEVRGVTAVPAVAGTTTEYDPQVVSLSMNAPLTGSYAPLTERRVYRTSTGATGTDYLLVATMLPGTTIYEDRIDSSVLSEACPTIGSANIPEFAQGLTALPNGTMACFKGYDVYLCDIFKPYSWPDAYRQTTDFPVVGLGAFGQSIAVLTTGVPYVISGTDPQSMSMEKLTVPYACLSKRSVVQAFGGVIYAAADGLVVIDNSGPRVLTEALFTRREWQLLNPASMMCCVWDDRLFIFYDTGSVRGSLILDSTNGLTTTSYYANAAFTDTVTGSMFFAAAGKLWKWDAGGVGQYQWKSRRDVQLMPKNFSFGQVVATQYPITMSVYADLEVTAEAAAVVAANAVLTRSGSVVKYTTTVSNSRPFRLPSGFCSRYWEVELSGAGRVLSALIAGSAQEIQNV